MTADQTRTRSGAGAVQIGAVQIGAMTVEDWTAVRAIYQAGIATGNATFETQPPGWDRFNTGKLAVGRLVATDKNGAVLGWTALSLTSTRPVYSGVVEHSVYVAEEARGRGVGRQLLQAMITAAEAAGIWTIQSSIFAENTTSLALHAALGFRTVGRRERIAKMAHGPWAGQWRDTILIERRTTHDPQHDGTAAS